MAALIPPVVKKTVTGDYGYSPAEVPDLSGRVAVVTGGTNGIGLALSRVLYTHGCTLHVLGHSKDIGDQGVAYIKSGNLADAPPDYVAGFGNRKQLSDQLSDGGRKTGTVDFVQVDFEDLKAVADVAISLKSKLERLDLYLNNAGKGLNAFALTKDGYDSHLTLNNLAPHLLLSHLFSTMRKTVGKPNADVRIVNMSSEEHRATFGGPGMFGGKFRDEQEWKDDVGPQSLYARTKLGLLLFTRALVQRFVPPPDPILTYATHPGAVATGQQDQFKNVLGETLGGVAASAVRPFMRVPAEGCLSMLWCAVAPELRHGEWEGKSGTYFSDPKELGMESGEAKDQELTDNFFEGSEKIIRKVVGDEKMGKWHSI